MKKKIMSVLLMASIIAALTACGSSGESTDTDTINTSDAILSKTANTTLCTTTEPSMNSILAIVISADQDQEVMISLITAESHGLKMILGKSPLIRQRQETPLYITQLQALMRNSILKDFMILAILLAPAE